MKKIGIPFLLLAFSMNLACKSGDKKPKDKEGQPKSAVDSLLVVIEKGHIDGMGKIGRLHNARKAVQAALDSLGRLPAAAQQAARGYMDELNATIKDIDYADFSMDKWMMEYRQDSAMDNETERIKYLEGEKIKVEAMSAAIRNSIQKADSLLKPRL